MRRGGINIGYKERGLPPSSVRNSATGNAVRPVMIGRGKLLWVVLRKIHLFLIGTDGEATRQ